MNGKISKQRWKYSLARGASDVLLVGYSMGARDNTQFHGEL
jgi:hypothetical protein